MDAAVELPCLDLSSTARWFEDHAGFRTLMITPADDPTVSVLSGHGMTIRLDCNSDAPPAKLRIPARQSQVLTAPNGTIIEFVAPPVASGLPANEPEFVLSTFSNAEFGTGRAGMAYRDLIPDRQGGRYIASHISIPDGGPVPDYVHHHDIAFQMIFCHAGWADLVYQDQGPAFRMQAGDCVLQPPHIRHRVLETSDLFEVVEVSSPAVHDTMRDHDLELPTSTVDASRDFGGQLFRWHQADTAITSGGFTSFGIDTATNGLATVGLLDSPSAPNTDDVEFLFWFVRSGTADLDGHGLHARDSVTFVPGQQYALNAVSSDFEVLEVRI